MTNLNINQGVALAKAKDAVANWKAGVAKAELTGTKKEIEFCRGSLQACERNLESLKASFNLVHEWN